jgi:hypothetical protein
MIMDTACIVIKPGKNHPEGTNHLFTSAIVGLFE